MNNVYKPRANYIGSSNLRYLFSNERKQFHNSCYKWIEQITLQKRIKNDHM
jgi:hypothetical protein